jgi:hypothetical protein
MTKLLLSTAAVCFLSCAKYEVPTESMRNNVFDPAYVGPSMLIVDSVVTVALIAGTVYQQRIHGHVDPALLRGGPVSIRMVETTEGDVFTVSPAQLVDGRFRLDNQQVTLGVQYCFQVTPVQGGSDLLPHRWEECIVAEL